MDAMIRKVDQCRVCGRDDWLDVISFGSTPLANGFLDPAPHYQAEPTYPLEVVVCRGCWLMSLRHVVDPAALFSHYVYVSSDSRLIKDHMRRIVDWCAERLGLAHGDLVVEMGSNVGTQLELFQRRSLRTVGVDPARNLARIANERGVTTIADFFGGEATSSILRDHGTAALVLGRQCFAHIDDIHEIVTCADSLLEPDGALVIEVPYLVDLLDQNQFDTIYHEHLSYFSLGTLSNLFESHGLRVFDVERVGVHGGSVVVFASRTGARWQTHPRVGALLALEARNGLWSERPYREFADRTRRVTAAVRAIVRDVVAGGGRVAGYGAPSKGTTLLQACGLGPAEVEFCSDTTAMKHGKVLPGTHIPVWPPEQARAYPPDYYLLLAWNYAEEIIRKEQPFLQQGGRFIVPIPEPRVVSAAEQRGSVE